MPISRKRFSKKRLVKKSMKKNTRKYKKRTPRRKHKKSTKRVRFFGGYGEDEDCAICTEPLTPETTFTTNCQHNFHRACIERWCSGKAMCPCPMCKTPLNPNPNPIPYHDPQTPPGTPPNFGVSEDTIYYKVEFFKFVNNPATGEIDRVKVSVHDMTDETLVLLERYFREQFRTLQSENVDFFGGQEEIGNPNGYILLYSDSDPEIEEGDIDINIQNQDNIQSATITRTEGWDNF
jgi:hypothetical protein